MRSLALSLVLMTGCATAGDLGGDVATTDAPLVGVDGSTDQADRNCHVVLRSLARNTQGSFSFETSGSSWVWSGVIEISQAAADEGLVPELIYHHGSNPAWLAATVTPIAGDATHFVARLDHDLVGPGMSATAITSARIDAEPFLRMAGGGRLFDHNRNASDFANYVMTYPDLAIARADGVCGAPTSARHANLVFDGAHQQHQDGQITAGGSLTIQYDVGRLPTCRNSQGGHPLWDLTAHVRFEPTGELLAASVRDGAATFAVPTSGATRVAVWFENTSSTGCQAWDSNYGNNYVFDLAHAPQWIGNAATRISRDTSDPCEGGVPAAQAFSFDTWSRQRAAFTNLCFDVYEPGLTDRDDPELWKKLDASIVYRIVGESTWHTQAANVSSRHGNDARFATSWRPIDPFRMYNCPVVAPTPSADPQYMQLRVEYYVVVNGAELRPATGATFTGVFSDYLAPRCTP